MCFVQLENSFTQKESTALPLKGCKNARHSRPLSCDGSLACHTYRDTGSHLRGPVTLTPVAER